MSDDALDRSAVIQELARAIQCVALGDDAEASLIILGLARTTGSAQSSLPGVPAAPAKMSVALMRNSAAGRLFAYWQQKCDHEKAKLTGERTRAIVARLKEGYTETEIRKAIDGAAVAAFVHKDTGERYDDLTLICRDGSRLESFITRGVTATGAIVAEVDDASPVEEQISALRLEMSALYKAGRTTEYKAAAERLRKLMEGRSS